MFSNLKLPIKFHQSIFFRIMHKRCKQYNKNASNGLWNSCSESNETHNLLLTDTLKNRISHQKSEIGAKTGWHGLEFASDWIMDWAVKRFCIWSFVYCLSTSNCFPGQLKCDRIYLGLKLVGTWNKLEKKYSFRF